MPAQQLLKGIQSGDLHARAVTSNGDLWVEVLSGSTSLFAIRCNRVNRPVARMGRDSKSVDVFPSIGLPDGFAFPCDTAAEAYLIVEALDECLEAAFLELTRPKH